MGLIASLSRGIRAEDFYVAQVAQGTATGKTPGDALAVGFVNDPRNWSSPTKVAGRIGPGDIIHLVGTIGTAIIFQGSGSPGQEIVLKFESGAKLSAPAWSSVGAIVLNSISYAIVDGGDSGLIENTNNGTGLLNRINSVGVQISGGSFVTVQNLRIENLYVRQAGGDSGGTAAWGIAIRGTASGMKGMKVANCVIHDAATGIVGEYSIGCSGYEFRNNTIYNINHGIVVPDRAPGATVTDVVIAQNKIYSFQNWNDTVNNGFHHNAVYAWAVQGGSSSVKGLVIDGNTFGPGLGNAYQTSLVFTEGAVMGSKIVNNFLIAEPGEYAANGFLALGSWLSCDFEVYNNNFKGGGAGALVSVSGNSVQKQRLLMTNNVAIGRGGGTFVALYNVSTAFNVGIDHNIAANFSASPYSYSTGGSLSPRSFPEWRALGFDSHGSYSTDSAYVKVSQVKGAGANLSALFSNDAVGITRQSVGSAWDVGNKAQPTVTSPQNLRLVQ